MIRVYMLYDLKYIETYFMAHKMVFLGEDSMNLEEAVHFAVVACSVLINANAPQGVFSERFP